jgi:plastocyanin
MSIRIHITTVAVTGLLGLTMACSQEQPVLVAPTAPEPAAALPGTATTEYGVLQRSDRDRRQSRSDNDRSRRDRYNSPSPRWTPSPRPSHQPTARPSHRRRDHRDNRRDHRRRDFGSVYYFPYNNYYYPYYLDAGSYYSYAGNDYPYLYNYNGSYYPYSSGGQEAYAGAAVQDATVVISNHQFQPQTIRVLAGGTISWINMDSTAHTATPEVPGAFIGTGAITPRATSTVVTLGSPGQIRYYCQYHPEMRGTIIVE